MRLQDVATSQRQAVFQKQLVMSLLHYHCVTTASGLLPSYLRIFAAPKFQCWQEVGKKSIVFVCPVWGAIPLPGTKEQITQSERATMTFMG